MQATASKLSGVPKALVIIELPPYRPGSCRNISLSRPGSISDDGLSSSPDLAAARAYRTNHGCPRPQPKPRTHKAPDKKTPHTVLLCLTSGSNCLNERFAADA